MHVLIVEDEKELTEFLAWRSRRRRRGNKTSILVLTARGTVPGIAKALDIGTDDYMTSSLHFEELAGTLRSVSARVSDPRPKVVRVHNLVLNAATHEARRAGKNISLSRMQFRLLETLMRNSGQIVSRNVLARSVWDSSDVKNNMIDVSIYQLRQKVDRDHKVKLIKTVPKMGYAIRDPMIS